VGRSSRIRNIGIRASAFKTQLSETYLSLTNKSIAALSYAVREGKDHRFLAIDESTNEAFKSMMINLGLSRMPVMVQIVQPYPVSFVGNMRLKRNRVYISVPKSLHNIHEALWHDGRTFPIIITPLTVAMTHVEG
jgi:hypothetical protein